MAKLFIDSNSSEKSAVLGIQCVLKTASFHLLCRSFTWTHQCCYLAILSGCSPVRSDPFDPQVTEPQQWKMSQSEDCGLCETSGRQRALWKKTEIANYSVASIFFFDNYLWSINEESRKSTQGEGISFMLFQCMTFWASAEYFIRKKCE